MAIRVLLDHGVPEDHIIFVAFLVARAGGISVFRRAFPKVKIVCGAVDDEMLECWLDGSADEGETEGEARKVWLMDPGMGQIGMDAAELIFEPLLMMIAFSFPGDRYYL